jgi:hypothetical protein
VQHRFQLPSIYGQEISTSYVEPCDNFDTPEFQETIVRGKHAYGLEKRSLQQRETVLFLQGFGRDSQGSFRKGGDTDSGNEIMVATQSAWL